MQLLCCNILISDNLDCPTDWEADILFLWSLYASSFFTHPHDLLGERRSQGSKWFIVYRVHIPGYYAD